MEFRVPRRKALFGLCFCVLLLLSTWGFALWLRVKWELHPVPILILAMGLVLLLSLPFAIRDAIWPGRLNVRPEGLRVDYTGIHAFLAWDDIASMKVGSWRGGPLIMISVKRGLRGWNAAAARWIWGCDVALGSEYFELALSVVGNSLAYYASNPESRRELQHSESAQARLEELRRVV